MDHYSKCNICGEMVKNMRQHEKHKHRSSQKASVAMLSMADAKKHKKSLKTTLIVGQMCHMI